MWRPPSSSDLLAAPSIKGFRSGRCVGLLLVGAVVHHMSEPVAMEAMFFSSLVCLITPLLLSGATGLHPPGFLLVGTRGCSQGSGLLRAPFSTVFPGQGIGVRQFSSLCQRLWLLLLKSLPPYPLPIRETVSQPICPLRIRFVGLLAVLSELLSVGLGVHLILSQNRLLDCLVVVGALCPKVRVGRHRLTS